MTRNSINDRKICKVLVFGAGVIGAYLAHVLVKAGNDVTILAREERAKSLDRNGLVIYHHLHRAGQRSGEDRNSHAGDAGQVQE